MPAKAVAPWNAAREFDRKFRTLTYRHSPWEVWADFVHLSATALDSMVVLNQAHEDAYMRTIKKYAASDDRFVFPELLGITWTALSGDRGATDFLGEAYLRHELSNHWTGQFFTPMNLAQMMAEMTFLDAPALIAEKGYLSIAEPAVGAGCLLLAAANVLRKQGIDIGRDVMMMATDIDPVVAHMAMIQLSAIGASAMVMVGNSLAMTVTDTFRTPAWWLNGWEARACTEGFLVTPAEAAAREAERVAAEEAQKTKAAITPRAKKGQEALW